MRLMAKEDDVYKLMDRRDLYLGAAGLCGIVSVVLLLFISYGYGNWENLYFLSVLIVGMIFLLYYTWKINQRIMEDMSPAVFFIRKLKRSWKAAEEESLSSMWSYMEMKTRKVLFC